MNSTSGPASITNMESNVADTSMLYHPTALEFAYGSFLLQTHFFQSPNLAYIQVPGRNAVPFLTKSNLPRDILRAIWNVADPDGIGTLTQRQQFQLILRLTSMAQVGIVVSSDLAHLQQCLQQHQNNPEIPLATFGDVIIPPHHVLLQGNVTATQSNDPMLQTPQQHVVQPLPEQQTVPPPTINSVPPTDTLTAGAAMLPPQSVSTNNDTSREPHIPVTAPSVQTQTSGTTNETGIHAPEATLLHHVSSAFDSLAGELEDKPLPSLSEFASSSSLPAPEDAAGATNVTETSVGQEMVFGLGTESSNIVVGQRNEDQVDDFGDFVESKEEENYPNTLPSESEPKQITEIGHQIEKEEEEDDFGDFVETQPDPVISNDNQQTSDSENISIQETEEDSSFGDFAQPSTSDNADLSVNKEDTEVQTDSNQEELSSHVEKEDIATKPVTNDGAKIEPGGDDGDGDGDGDTVETKGTKENLVGNDGVYTAALDLQTPQDQHTVPPSVTNNMESAPEQPAEVPLSQPSAAVEQQQQPDMSQTTSTQDDKFSVFDDLLGPGVPQPELPPLQLPPLVPPQQQQQPSLSLEDIMNVVTSSTSSLPGVPAPVAPISIFSSQQQLPFSANTDDDDDFGDFEDAVATKPSGEEGNAAPLHTATSTLPQQVPTSEHDFVDAAATVIPGEDPITEPVIASFTEQQQVPINDDDFGDFADAVVTDSNVEGQIVQEQELNQPPTALSSENPQGVAVTSETPAANNDLSLLDFDAPAVTETQLPTGPPAPTTAETDGFGDFFAPSTTTTTEASVQPTAPQQQEPEQHYQQQQNSTIAQLPPPVQEEHDLFGDFAEPEGPSGPQNAVASGEHVNPTATTMESNDESFGDFTEPNVASAHEDNFGKSAEPATATSITENSGFADFAEGTAAPPVENSKGFADFAASPEAQGSDSFGDFAQSAAAPETAEDDFGDFAEPPAANEQEDGGFASFDASGGVASKRQADSEPDDVVVVEHDNPADGFGANWGDFEQVAMPDPNPPTTQENDDDFGEWSAFDEPAASVPDVTKTKSGPLDHVDEGRIKKCSVAELADFALQAEMLEIGLKAKKMGRMSKRAEIARWRELLCKRVRGEIDPCNYECMTLSEMEARISSLCGQLPDLLPVTQTKEATGIISSFQENVGTGPFASTWLPLGEQAKSDPSGARYRRKRAERCLALVAHLTSSDQGNSTVVQKWSRLTSVARDELSVGKLLLEELGTGSFSSAEKQYIVSSSRFCNFVAGLAEYVRVVRLVVATIGDIMCLPVEEAFSSANLLKWGSSPILACALEVEEAWSAIESEMKKLQMHCITQESVPELRKPVLEMENLMSDFCGLTLQPFATQNKKSPGKIDSASTRSRLLWGGKSFLACAANLYANRVSTVVPV